MAQDGATQNPHKEPLRQDCMVPNADGTPGTGRAHNWLWVWTKDGRWIDELCCSTCGKTIRSDEK